MTAAVIETPRLLRLVPCPRCHDRRRTLVEAGGEMRGHCLGCGRLLPSPLAVESLSPHAAHVLVPRLRHTARVA